MLDQRSGPPRTRPARASLPAGARLAVMVAVLGTWTAEGAIGQRPDSSALDRFERSLDSLVPALLEELATPGAAVALIRDGQVVVTRGYGWADREARLPVTPRTLFNVGSISKTVTAWGVMHLVEQHDLALDEPVERYLTRWHLPPSGFDHDGVTLRRLLSHTAGLSLHGYSGFGPDEKLPSLEESLSGATGGRGDVRVVHPPGSRWQYSGGGYTLAQLLVEEVTGRRFQDVMRSDVLEPLGMTASGFGGGVAVRPVAATPYGPLGPIPARRYTAQAAAGLWTSIEDFTRFALASLSANPQQASTAVLTPATLRLMQQPVPSSPVYGLGYQLFRVLDGSYVVGHGGSNVGWNARFIVAPGSGDGLIVFTNAGLGIAVHDYLFCRWGQAAFGDRGRCAKDIGAVMTAAVMHLGVERATRLYRTLRETQAHAYRFREADLNTLGYALLSGGRIEDATAIFRLNVEAYPQAWNAHDSLGEACLASGDTAAAVAAYERSLELNPDNRNAVRVLRGLGRRRRGPDTGRARPQGGGRLPPGDEEHGTLVVRSAARPLSGGARMPRSPGRVDAGHRGAGSVRRDA